MQKIKTVKEYVEKMDAAKKVNPKDLSSDQDLSIGIMNLISIEEHLMFSGAKTGKHEFYDMINEVREMRKRMMQKIIPSYEGEVWCISKHLLASAMRLFEVGTKALASGDTETAYSLFDDSYELYCIFWGLNMGAFGGDMKHIKTPQPDTKKSKSVSQSTPGLSDTDNSKIGKLKNWVRNAVNCCIE